MQEFIAHAASALGVSDDTARQATSSLLAIVSKSATAADFRELLDRLPGAAGLYKPEPRPATNGFFGALGGLMANASSALGSIGGSGALMQFLSSSGLSPQQAGQFAKLFIAFARQHAGDDLVERVISSIPGARARME